MYNTKLVAVKRTGKADHISIISENLGFLS